MTPEIRPFQSEDLDQIVEFSLRAWEPVYESLEDVLGSDIFLRQHPDWREDQRRAVRDTCLTDGGLVRVAVTDGVVSGFVAVALHHPEREMGEITMLGVDPVFQGRGIGSALTDFAIEHLREAGMRVAMVETGGDPGHAPARRTYEKAGFTELPISRYFMNL